MFETIKCKNAFENKFYFVCQIKSQWKCAKPNETEKERGAQEF